MNVKTVYLEQALEKQLLVEQCQRVKQRNTELAVSAEQLSSQLSVRCESLNITGITCCDFRVLKLTECNYHHNHFAAFFRDRPGEPVPEENFWTVWCKGRLTEADTPTVQLGAAPSRLTSAHLHHPPYFLQAGCPSCRPTNSVKALKSTSYELKIRAV